MYFVPLTMAEFLERDIENDVPSEVRNRRQASNKKSHLETESSFTTSALLHTLSTSQGTQQLLFGLVVLGIITFAILVLGLPTFSKHALDAKILTTNSATGTFLGVNETFVNQNVTVSPMETETSQIGELSSIIASLSPDSKSESLVVLPEIKGAYVIQLCLEEEADAVFVLLHSLARTETKFDILVMISAQISLFVQESIKLLGAKVTPIEKGVTGLSEEVAWKMLTVCRFSKLWLWTLTDYDALLFLSVNILVVENVDDVLQASCIPIDSFSQRGPNDERMEAAWHGELPVMVVKPNNDVYKRLLEQVATNTNVDDADRFLHSFLRTAENASSIARFPRWNQRSTRGKSGSWPFRWMIYNTHPKPWEAAANAQSEEQESFQTLWLEARGEVYEFLRTNGGEEVQNGAQMANYCNHDYSLYSNSSNIVEGKLTVIINGYDRIEALTYIVKRYAKMDFVHKVYIWWQNTQVAALEPSHFGKDVSAKIDVLYNGVNTLNNRFLPIPTMATQAVLVADDDVEQTEKIIKLMLTMWEENPQKLFGSFVRAHEINGATFWYNFQNNERFSMVLTKSFVFHADYLRMYSCGFPKALRDYVEEIINCEDIAFNFLVSRVSRGAPVAVADGGKIDYGVGTGLSGMASHIGERHRCVNDMANMLTYMSLEYSERMSALFDAKVVRHTQERHEVPR
eukprot:TRINITY_DN3299_c0_g3_i2.p1 TRINITY_DN3299_c0_g3~~TRINITY_DN3299_c0_g3_i2.p1  ORF type:complete len:687 (+),score=63.76 TRINITY_DN3299_c0_g3_i2:244-2304(+)